MFGLYAGPLLLAAAYGLLTALCFSLWPLGRAARIPGGALFRDALMPESTRPSPLLIVANLVLAAALVGLTVATATDRSFALYFCVAAALTLALFRAGGMIVTRLARIAPALPWPAARLGVSNLHRPGTPTPLLLLSAGLGLSTLAAVALIQGNMQHQIQEQLPANAPSFYLSTSRTINSANSRPWCMRWRACVRYVRCRRCGHASWRSRAYRSKTSSRRRKPPGPCVVIVA